MEAEIHVQTSSMELDPCNFVFPSRIIIDHLPINNSIIQFGGLLLGLPSLVGGIYTYPSEKYMSS